MYNDLKKKFQKLVTEIGLADAIATMHPDYWLTVEGSGEIQSALAKKDIGGLQYLALPIAGSLTGHTTNRRTNNPDAWMPVGVNRECPYRDNFDMTNWGKLSHWRKDIIRQLRSEGNIEALRDYLEAAIVVYAFSVHYEYERNMAAKVFGSTKLDISFDKTMLKNPFGFVQFLTESIARSRVMTVAELIRYIDREYKTRSEREREILKVLRKAVQHIVTDYDFRFVYASDEVLTYNKNNRDDRTTKLAEKRIHEVFRALCLGADYRAYYLSNWDKIRQGVDRGLIG